MRPQSHSSFLNQTAPPDSFERLSHHKRPGDYVNRRGGVYRAVPAVNPLWLTGANPVTASLAPQMKRGGWPVTSSTDIHVSPFGSASARGALTGTFGYRAVVKSKGGELR